MRRVIIHHQEEGYWAECPSLPGCISQGETWDEVVANIKAAIDLWIDAALDDGDLIPPDDVPEFQEIEIYI